ncbi:hypothetical protein MJO28_013688 [Puccinia striiformis f. sp. tritici]|uniref:Uncharacterized protein n=1 Tax=Puccinia striiformis f. sp. tritici TaxID=168172 RepID=A0ACC0DVG7_9BASI|nr:hypothetical protein MJO28_013688 [Puccinia striiformis f. sp. tritici]
MLLQCDMRLPRDPINGIHLIGSDQPPHPECKANSTSIVALSAVPLGRNPTGVFATSPRLGHI